MNTLKSLVLLLSIVLCASGADEVEDAKLLVAKSILNNYLVEGLDLSVRYTVYNTGSVAALNVLLKDENFPEDKFEQVSGFKSVRWAKVSPSSNVSHVAIVRPKITGPFNLTHATVTYTPSESNTKTQTGYSTDLGEVYIQRLKDYNRKFASHTIDWFLFVVMATPSIAFPYFLWLNSKRRYETKASKSKTN